MVNLPFSTTSLHPLPAASLGFFVFSESATATGFSLSGLSISLCLEALSKSHWLNWSSSYYDTVMLG